jgi:hypothetical protein
MATTYKADGYVKGSYSVDIPTGDSHVFEVAMDVSTTLVELIFPTGTGSGTVYASLDSLDKIRTMIADEDETGITWTKWDLGDVTNASSDKIGTAYAPCSFKFTNLGATTIRFNFRGIFGA